MNKLKVVFAMLAVILGVGFASTTADAREINQEANNLVDNFKFLTDTLNQGEISSLTVSFSEKYDGQLKEGDTLTLKMPEGIKGMQDNGQPSKMQLKNAAGVVFGNVVITEGEAVVTFTDAVDKLDNIRGHFNIAIIAKMKDENDPTKEQDTVVSPLTMGLPEKNATGQPMANGPLTIRGVQKYVEEAPSGEFDHTKQGDMVSGVGNVRWFINVNQRQEKIDKFATDITIKDTLGPGQKFKSGSFMVSRTKWNDTLKKNETSWVSIPELQAAGWVQVVKDPSVDGKSFEIVLNVSDPKWTSELSGQSFSLSYITDVTDQSLPVFQNNLEMKYEIDGHPAIDDKHTYETKNIRLDGAADGDSNATKPPLTLNEFQDNVVEFEEEGIKELPDNTTKGENATEGTEVDETGKATENQPPVVMNEAEIIEEILTEEQLEILDDVIKEHAEGDLEDGHTHMIEIDGKPEVLTDKEIIEKLLTPDQKKKLEKIIEKHADMSGKKNVPGKKPEVKPTEKKPETKDEDKKAEVKPAEKKSETKTEDKKAEVKPTEKKSETKAEEKTEDENGEDLPETGYNKNILLSVAGVIIAALGIFFYKKTR